MREILFKAKRIDNGEWIVGCLINLDDDTYRIATSCLQNEADELLLVCSYEVAPSTICQYTGLVDKNGQKIWENDVCRRTLLPTKRIKTNFRIAYVPYKCCLSAIDLDGSNVTFLSDYINNQYEVEVIGNIFDNPELMNE